MDVIRKLKAKQVIASIEHARVEQVAAIAAPGNDRTLTNMRVIDVINRTAYRDIADVIVDVPGVPIHVDLATTVHQSLVKEHESQETSNGIAEAMIALWMTSPEERQEFHRDVNEQTAIAELAYDRRMQAVGDAMLRNS